MSEARQLFMEVSLAAQKQSFSEVEALNTFRGPQGPRGEPGGVDNLVINGKEAVPVDGKNTINLTPADVYALPSDGTAVNANALNGKSADEYLQKSQVVNNFTTTGEGFVADARALKTLHDGKTSASILANGEQSMGNYSKVTIRSTNPLANLRCTLLMPTSIYTMVVGDDGSSLVTKIGGSDISYAIDVIGEVTLTIPKWTRFKLIVLSGTYDLIYSD